MALAVIVPVIVVATWAASDASASANTATSEQRGVRYLQPLTRLLTVLVTAQGAAVRGEAVDAAAVQAQINAVEKVEAQYGSDLSTGARWPTLRDSIKELSQRPGAAGLEAYQKWSQAVDLTVALMRRVGDTSKLILDPELDTYYLMDAGLLRLPEVIQAAGQLADLLVVTRASRSAQDEIRLGVLRDRIATASAAVNNGLGKVVDTTSSGRVGSALLSPLDQFGAATDALAPSVAVAMMPPLPDNVPAASVGVRDSAERLANTVWTQLDDLLDSRASGHGNRRLLTFAAALVGIVAGILVGLLLWRRRPAAPARPVAEPTQPTPPGQSGGPAHHGHHYYQGPGGVDPAVSAITGTPRAPAGVR
jgi:hypothetical protein